MGTYKLSSQNKSVGSGSAKLRANKAATARSSGRDTSTADNTPEEYRQKAAAAQQEPESTPRTKSTISTVQNSGYVPSPVNPAYREQYIQQQQSQTTQKIISPHSLGSDVTVRTSITSQPQTNVREVEEGVVLPTEKATLSHDIMTSVSDNLARGQENAKGVTIWKPYTILADAGSQTSEKLYNRAAEIRQNNDSPIPALSPFLLTSVGNAIDMGSKLPAGRQIMEQRPSIIGDAFLFGAASAVAGTIETAKNDPVQLASDLFVFSILGEGLAGAGKSVSTKIPKITELNLKAFAKDEAASVNYWQAKYDFSKPRVNAFESEVPQIGSGAGGLELVAGNKYSGLNPLLELRIRSQKPSIEINKPFESMTALERYQASKGTKNTAKSINMDSSAQITQQRVDSVFLNKLVSGEKVTPKSVDSIFLNKLLSGEKVTPNALPDIQPAGNNLVGIKRYSNKPLSEVPDSFLTPSQKSNYWQAKYDFSKPRVKAFESEVPQMSPKAITEKTVKPVALKERFTGIETSEKSFIQSLIDAAEKEHIKTSLDTRIQTKTSLGTRIQTKSILGTVPKIDLSTKTAAKTSVFPDVSIMAKTSPYAFNNPSPSPSPSPYPSLETSSLLDYVPEPKQPSFATPIIKKKPPKLDFEIDMGHGKRSPFDPNIGIKKGSRKNKFGDVNKIIFGR